MSTYLVTAGHIDALVSYCRAESLRFIVPAEGTMDGQGATLAATDDEGARAIGQVLFDQNARSLAARYGADDTGAAEGFAAAESYAFHPFPESSLTPAFIIGAASCFDYQACECDSWNMSLAAWITAGITKRAAYALATRQADALGKARTWAIGENPNRPELEPAPALAPAPKLELVPAEPRTLKDRIAAGLAGPMAEPELEAARAARAPDSESTHSIHITEILPAVAAAYAETRQDPAPETDAERAARRKARAAELGARRHQARKAAKESAGRVAALARGIVADEKQKSSPAKPPRQARKAKGAPTAP
jgi:hypothetical protein